MSQGGFHLWSLFGFSQLGGKEIVMMLIGGLLIYLAIQKKYEPLLLLPIGLGILIGNIPAIVISGKEVFSTDAYSPQSPFYYLYWGLDKSIYPALIFLGIGAMTDFGPLLVRPRLILIGAAAQLGIFTTTIIAILIGFSPQQAGSIGIIGAADGPSAIFLTSLVAPELLAPIIIAAYSYIALVPVIQPPIMRFLTTKKERRIKMNHTQAEPSRLLKIIFPISFFLIGSLISQGAAMLLGMLAFGNLLRESGVTDRLARTARTSITDITTILIGLCVGVSATGDKFLNYRSLLIFLLGATAFAISTASGVLFAKLINLVSRDKINPLIGAAGVSALPDSARVVQMVATEADPHNFILLQAMAPNVAGQIASAICAGILFRMLGG